ncbi:MAG: D-arabinono-1,4-lactone oxidase [Nocardioides sp.]|uniref:D-arabinono-1,4-lactone oxidase n=1 Tax=Nocardioides sp. TaxID=35761 RepID=UPI0039E53E79
MACDQIAAAHPDPRGWTNWAGNQRARPGRVAVPRSTDELAEVIRTAAAAGSRVRPIGSGHSFTPIGVPTAVQLRLDRLAGIVHADAETGLVTVRGGTRLRELNRGLAALGLAMTNLGDIEEQTIAGALATGTHGTGAGFGGLATQIRGLELMLADGSLRRCGPEENADLFDLARVGLGALGVVTTVTLQTERLFALTAREGSGRLDEVMAGFDEHADGTDHFEFYWFPHTRSVLTKHNTRHPLDSTQLAPLSRARAWWDDEFLSNGVFGATVALGNRVPRLVPGLANLAARALSPRTYTDLSYRVFTSARRVRFVEMEYAVPRESGMAVLGELVEVVARSGWRISFPVEVRVAAADEVPLSTGYGRSNVYIAIHTAPGAPDQRAYFAAFERIATAAGGRPHWGKMHGLGAADLRERYPRFDDFVAMRDRVDPGRLFGNDHLAHLLGG